MARICLCILPVNASDPDYSQYKLKLGANFQSLNSIPGFGEHQKMCLDEVRTFHLCCQSPDSSSVFAFNTSDREYSLTETGG